MNLKRYFRHQAESDLGEGIAYIEFSDGWPVRQVEIYGEHWRCADEHDNEWLADRPLDQVGLEPEDKIIQTEFETVVRLR